jgi:anti-sigma factor RsiW
MNHEQAVQEMATERYLLDEMSPELRDAFEEHLFECPECTLDVRAGNVFMTEAKVQLPQIAAQAAAQAPPRPAAAATKKPWWSVFAMPAFAAPAFAALLAVIAFQNLATIPSLRSAATEPRIIPWSALHAGTRGTEPTAVQADRKQGAVVLIDLPQQPYSSYAIDLYDPQGKRFWTQTVPAPTENNGAPGTLSLLIPGAELREGAYTLNLAGISPQGARTEIGRRVLDLHLTD